MTISNEILEVVRERAGIHASNPVPEDARQRVLFGLLEILDFKCVENGDFVAATNDEIRAYLRANLDEVLKLPEPPSYIGFIATNGYGLFEVSDE